MARLTYFFKRLLQMIPVLIVVVVLIFFMIRLIPGDPARLLLGEAALEEDVQRYREMLGLNEPLITQFGIFVRDLLHFDFGDSIVYKMPLVFEKRVIHSTC